MPDTLSEPLRSWQTFYLLVGTAAATLVGLMFVTISLGSRLMTRQSLPALRTYVSPTLIHFIYVLITATVVVIPTVTRTLLGILLLFVGFVSCGRSLSGLPLMRRQHREQSIDMHDWVWYLLAPSASYLLFVATGIGLLLRVSQALNGLALASIVLLVVGIRNAWDMVVHVVLLQSEPPERGSSMETPAQGGDSATTERQADPMAQPHTGHDDTPTSLALPPSQQADITRIIQEAGLNPSAFTWAVQPSRYALIGPLVSALVHTRTGCYFRFEFTEDASGQKRVSVFIPGKGTQEVAKAAGSWEDQLGQVRTWLQHLGDARR